MILQSNVGNLLLGAASPSDFALLQPRLTRIVTCVRQTLIAPYTPVETLFFPETGFVSITSPGRSDSVEVGLIGREGLVGASPVLLESDITPFASVVRSPGEGLSIDAAHLKAAVDQSESLRSLLLRFVYVLLIQTEQTAFANATCSVEARLARWLLMCQDRGGDQLSITHAFLAMMLGVQRARVTLALKVLEGRRLIAMRRGRISIVDRNGLRSAAGPRYGAAEVEYERLIGRSHADTRSAGKVKRTQSSSAAPETAAGTSP